MYWECHLKAYTWLLFGEKRRGLWGAQGVCSAGAENPSFRTCVRNPVAQNGLRGQLQVYQQGLVHGSVFLRMDSVAGVLLLCPKTAKRTPLHGRGRPVVWGFHTQAHGDPLDVRKRAGGKREERWAVCQEPRSLISPWTPRVLEAGLLIPSTLWSNSNCVCFHCFSKLAHT